MLDRRPLTFDPLPPGGGTLRFPGKVLADAASNRLFIADSGHNRIVVADLDGRVTMAIGDGEPGFGDGPADEARFNHPQGLALDAASETLFVADEPNHAIRAIDLASGQVTTVAGTGEHGYDRMGGGPGDEMSLSSPWDLALVGQRPLDRHGRHPPALGARSGDRPHRRGGRDRRRVDPRRPAPAGDLRPAERVERQSTASSTSPTPSRARFAVSIPGDDRVRRLVGRGLFDLGDVDGVAGQARLQHPLGVAATTEDGAPVVYVADTYNDKLKRLDPMTREVTSWAGGEHGHEDGELAQARFWEPSGLSLAGRRLYVADTNNHAVR